MRKDALPKLVLILLSILLTSAIAYFASPFLIPLTLALLLAMMLVPFCRWQESKGIGRTLASVLCVLIFAIAIAVVLALLSWQLAGFGEDIAQLKENMFRQFNHVKAYLSNTFDLSKNAQQNIVQKSAPSDSNTGKVIAKFFAGLGGFITNVVLVIVYIFLVLLYRTHFKEFILKLVKQQDKAETKRIIEESSKVVQSYLGGLAAMIACLWVMYGIGFSIVGVKHAIFFAVLCGLLEIVPFVGNLTGNALTVLMVLSQGGSLGMVAGVLITYSSVQFIQSYLLQPLVVGSRVNLNAFFTIAVLVVGNLIWGIGGMVMAIPLTGIIKIVCEHITPLQPFAFLLGTGSKKNK
jgi:predicted PurR-regulated permease PerM